MRLHFRTRRFRIHYKRKDIPRNGKGRGVWDTHGEWGLIKIKHTIEGLTGIFLDVIGYTYDIDTAYILHCP